VFEAKVVKGKAPSTPIVALLGQTTTVVNPPHGLPIYELPLDESEDVDSGESGSFHTSQFGSSEIPYFR
jgi:hypothetical protein